MDNVERNKYKFSNAPAVVDISEEAQVKREEQISFILKELFLYNVLLKDLISHKPSEKDKNLLLNISFYLVNNNELLEMFQSKREIPYSKLVKVFKLPKVFFERWQDYIITYTIILSNPNFKHIQDYLRIEEVEDNESSLSIQSEHNKEVKGIILKKNKFSSILLASNGDFIKSKNLEESDVGQEITSVEKIGFRQIKYKLAIIVLLIIVASFGVYKDYNTSIRTIILESTSKIKIETNRYDSVIYTYASTEKGKDMLKYANPSNKDLDNVICKCIEYAKNNNMIPEEGLLITVTGETIKYGKLELSGRYIYDNNIKVLINNSGTQHKLYEIMKEKLEENKE